MAGNSELFNIPNFLTGQSILSLVPQTDNDEPDDSDESDSSESNSITIENETLSEEDQRLLNAILNEISELAKEVSRKSINGEDFYLDFIILNSVKNSLHRHFTCHVNPDGSISYVRRQNRSEQATPDPDSASSSSDSD